MEQEDALLILNFIHNIAKSSLDIIYYRKIHEYLEDILREDLNAFKCNILVNSNINLDYINSSHYMGKTLIFQASEEIHWFVKLGNCIDDYAYSLCYGIRVDHINSDKNIFLFIYNYDAVFHSYLQKDIKVLKGNGLKHTPCKRKGSSLLQELYKHLIFRPSNKNIDDHEAVLITHNFFKKHFQVNIESKCKEILNFLPKFPHQRSDDIKDTLIQLYPNIDIELLYSMKYIFSYIVRKNTSTIYVKHWFKKDVLKTPSPFRIYVGFLISYNINFSKPPYYIPLNFNTFTVHCKCFLLISDVDPLLNKCVSPDVYRSVCFHFRKMGFRGSLLHNDKSELDFLNSLSVIEDRNKRYDIMIR